MKRALRCFGYVLFGVGIVLAAGLFGVGIVLAAGIVLFGGIGCLFWLSYATANLFDMPQYALCFVAGYFVLIAGGTVGVAICRDDQS